jgi:hypothetical protein
VTRVYSAVCGLLCSFPIHIDPINLPLLLSHRHSIDEHLSFLDSRIRYESEGERYAAELFIELQLAVFRELFPSLQSTCRVYHIAFLCVCVSVLCLSVDRPVFLVFCVSVSMSFASIFLMPPTRVNTFSVLCVIRAEGQQVTG